MPKKTDPCIELVDVEKEVDTVMSKTTKPKSTHKPMTKSSGSFQVQGVEIHLLEQDHEDYISLTDMTKAFSDGDTLIKAWLRNKNTIEFLGIWERINNPNFNLVEFDLVRSDAGLNSFTMSAKRWLEKVGGRGIIARSGRTGGGTFAHRDIAFEFGAWLSPEFKLYLIKEFQRLKEKEVGAGHLEWNIRRTLAKAQYRAHTDAVKNYLIPKQVSKFQEGLIYASEADLLNTALFGLTACEWRTANPDMEGNQRDQATIEQLVVLAGLESQNALLIEQGKTQAERLKILNEQVIKQMRALLASSAMKKITR